MDLANIWVVPTWGLVAFAVALLGALVAGVVTARARRAPSWTLALVPLAGVAGYAAATAPQNMVTLSLALASTGIALVMLLTGSLAVATSADAKDDRSEG